MERWQEAFREGDAQPSSVSVISTFRDKIPESFSISDEACLDKSRILGRATCRYRVKMSYLCRATRWMPLVLFVVAPASVLLTYWIAVARNDVNAFLPYISDTGTKPPESCIFGLLLSVVAFLLCVIVYIRYRQVSEWAKENPFCRITPLWNRLSACCGFVSALGLHMVANFQELNEFVTHIVGALLCFFSAIFYFFFQTIFTRRMRPKAKLMLWIRIVLTLLNVVFVAGTFGFATKALEQYKGNNMLKWEAKDGGFTYHVLSAGSEWLLVLSFCAYVLTLFWEFRGIEIEPVRIKLVKAKKEGTDGTTQTESEAIDEGTSKGLWI